MPSQSKSRNCRGVRSASRTIPPIVCASTGSCLGIVTIRTASVITMCLPCLATRKPAFSRALTARSCDTGYLRHTLRRDFHFSQVPFPGQFLRCLQVIVNGVTDIRQRFLFGGSLRPAARESRTRYAVPLFGPSQGYRILHIFQSSTCSSRYSSPQTVLEVMRHHVKG